MAKYGYSNSKCKYEVYDKNEIENFFNSKFSIISGSMTLEANTISEQDKWTQTQKEINYPTGFTENNCVVVSFGLETVTGKKLSYGYSVGVPNTLILLSGAYPRTVNLQSDKIVLKVGNFATDSKVVNYKIVLMKIPTE